MLCRSLKARNWAPPEDAPWTREVGTFSVSHLSIYSTPFSQFLKRGSYREVKSSRHLKVHLNNPTVNPEVRQAISPWVPFESPSRP